MAGVQPIYFFGKTMNINNCPFSMCEHHIFTKKKIRQPLCTLRGCAQPINKLEQWKRQAERKGKVQAGNLGIIPPR